MAVGKSHSSYKPLDDAVTIAEEFDIVAAKAGLIGVYELSNIALLRDVYVESYFASTENYRILRDEVEQPEKDALAYRDLVRAAVRLCVLEFKAFRPDDVLEMAEQGGIPEADRAAVVDYVGQQLSGLHEGNIIRYRLTPDDLIGVDLG